MTPLNNKIKSGFTLIELLVVIAIIGILSTLAIVALGNLRAKSRDAKRVADIKQISTTLDIFYDEHGYYPTLITPGNSLISSDNTKTYLAIIPSNPIPRNDGVCGDNEYTYYSATNDNYALNFCLGDSTGAMTAGINSYSSLGLNTAPGLVGSWKFEEGSGNVVKDTSGLNSKNGTWYGSGTHYSLGKSSLYSGQFDGSTNYIDLPNSNDFLVNSGSLSAWFYIDSSISGNNNRIIESGINSDRIGLFTDSTKRLGFYGVKNSGTTISLYSSALSTNTWYYGVGIWGVSGAKLYLNGAEIATTTGDRRLNLPIDTPACIGSYIANKSYSYYFFKGLIDNVSVYNRALSAQEVLALYNATK